MPNPYIEKVSKETGISVKELEKKWDDSKTAALQNHKESDEGFYGIVVTIFKNMLDNKVSESQLEKLVDSFYISEEGETTNSADIAQPDRMLLGRPLFRVDNDTFFKIGFDKRNRGWWQKFYGTKVGEWCRNNKGKNFQIENEDTNWLMDISAT